MQFEMLVTIQAVCNRYQYRMTADGKRDIDTNFPVLDTLIFKWDIDAVKMVVFRDGPSALNVDQYKMCFDYDDSMSLIGIHFEDSSHIWIIRNWRQFMNECKEAYCVMNRSHTVTITDPKEEKKEETPRQQNMTQINFDEEDDDDDIIDEFDFEEL